MTLKELDDLVATLDRNADVRHMNADQLVRAYYSTRRDFRRASAILVRLRDEFNIHP